MNKHPEFLLNKIGNPQDLKKFSLDEMKKLAEEIRTLILEKDSAEGGHLGPDLGIVEATIAYHYVFNAPEDKMVWDVSHQTYPHKMLTGRAYGWLDPDRYEDVTPYTNPDEGPYDYYAVGHTSTSIALATGMARARDLIGGHENIAALIGDGSLTGGMAFEGLNNAAVEKHNLLIVINDNQMSIDENVGGVVTALKKLRDSNGKAADNPFTAMGFDYRYVADGNDIQAMIDAFKATKDVDHPIVLHINTLKGKGYQPAVEHEREHHWVLPFDLKTDKTKIPSSDAPSAKSVAVDFIKDKIKAGENILAINAAIPSVFGLIDIKDNYPEHYKDVGIAEQESVAFAAGAVKEGAKPILFENSTFLQRAYDQLSHDIAANDLPITMIVTGGGISGQSKTHLGIFDNMMIANWPNWQYLAPTTLNELRSMLEWANKQDKHPVAIKMPVLKLPMGKEVSEDYSTIHYDIERGSKVAIIALGDFYHLGEQVRDLLKDKDINASLINPKSASDLDSEALDDLTKDHELVITLEDNQISGGFGQKIASYYGPTKMMVKNFGEKKEYTDNESRESIYKRNGLLPEQIVDEVISVLG
ncbi:1-deoxy-D-xylulose-5-phosphate synthase [Lactobacillus colini]|uniref:1-deoxy-D-xylulose-5-phosphate synthase n=1 Tax=Lactobacillus colini TaxID=1819254 RepID=A0ABS4MBS6_9LACO|nr:1-deoxy-D-xylulose-5-phosphate synthase [Lactobacillus colini]MBP2057110.1 1-deoxy-D-xylulose-5-phosphate synthase [Lactobacillus colini]